MAIATGILRDRHRQQRFPMLADFSPFRDVPQAVEIHIGAAVNRDQTAPLDSPLFDKLL